MSSAWLWLLIGCDPEPAEPAAPPVEEAAPEPTIYFFGCADVLDGPVCRLSSAAPLKLWTDAPPSLTVTLDGVPVEPTVEEAAGGQRLTIPDAVGKSEVVLTHGGGSWSLSLGAVEVTPHERFKKLETAELQAVYAETEDPVEKGVAAGLLARHFPEDEERWLGEADDRLVAAGAAAERDRVMSRHIMYAKSMGASPSKLTTLSRLIQSKDRAKSDLFLNFIRLYTLIEVELEAGLYRELQRSLDELIVVTERLGMAELAVSLMRWEILLKVGDLEEAVKHGQHLSEVQNGLSECDVVRVGSGLFWVLLEAERLGTMLSDGPVNPSTQEQYLTQMTEACAESQELTKHQDHALNNLVAHALFYGELERAESFHAQLSGTRSNENEALSLYHEGRIRQLRSDLDGALEAYDSLLSNPAIIAPRERWLAGAGKAEVHRQQGRPELAVDDYRQVLARFLEQSFLVPVHRGRDAFFDIRERDILAYVDLLLAADRADEAAEVLRVLRGQYVYGLFPGGLETEAARQRWQEQTETLRDLGQTFADAWRLSDDELAERQRTAAMQKGEGLDGVGSQRILRPRPPAAGELMVVLAQQESSVLGIALHGDAVRPVTAADPAGVLAQLSTEIAAAERISLMPYGALRDKDLHTVTVGGTPLAALKPTAYALDLPGERAAGEASGPALVLADPRLDLERARAEGTEVAGAVPGAQLMTGDTVTRQALLDGIEGARLLHYAGHATFDENPLDSAFLVAGDARVSVVDLLTVEQPPALVVLSACESARTPESTVEGLGLAQAMLLAGSRAVIATSRTVDDGLARNFSAAFYAHPEALSAPAVAYQSAMEQLSRSQPESDWGSFRLLSAL